MLNCLLIPYQMVSQGSSSLLKIYHRKTDNDINNCYRWEMCQFVQWILPGADLGFSRGGGGGGFQKFFQNFDDLFFLLSRPS